jgi:hypothetical protein
MLVTVQEICIGRPTPEGVGAVAPEMIKSGKAGRTMVLGSGSQWLEKSFPGE